MPCPLTCFVALCLAVCDYKVSREKKKFSCGILIRFFSSQGCGREGFTTSDFFLITVNEKYSMLLKILFTVSY